VVHAIPYYYFSYSGVNKIGTLQTAAEQFFVNRKTKEKMLEAINRQVLTSIGFIAFLVCFFY
jgi:hypothetical protein